MDARGRRLFHRAVADAARGRVHDAQERNVVVRIHQARGVGEHVLDFAAVEKAVSAHDPVRDFQVAEGRLEKARLRIHAEQDREVLPLQPLRDFAAVNLADDQCRLLLVVRHCEDAHFLPALLRAPQFLRAAPRVVFDERVRGAEDEVCRAVVLLQLDHRGIRKV